MKKTMHLLFLLTLLTVSSTLFACSTTNQSSQKGLPTNVRNTDTYTLGNEKNMLTPIQPLRSVEPVERDVKRIAGVVDAKVITYGNTIIVGALLEGQTTPRIYQRSSPIDRNRYTRNSAVSDGYDGKIIKTIRPKLAETDYKVVMITTNPLHFSRISKIRTQQQQGKSVPHSEMRDLLNEIGYMTTPYNLVD
ncbi:MAG: YhcN/YlaJ family sporulation lipoprotein [Brevibacillus sp.]|nr:YhcN/YlaJ family sporulation lipoprotein [Brevibacillus sp.]